MTDADINFYYFSVGASSEQSLEVSYFRRATKRNSSKGKAKANCNIWLANPI